MPTVEEQHALQLDFFDHYMKGEKTYIKDLPGIRYYHLGEEAFRATDVWPPAGSTSMRFYLSSGNELKAKPCTENSMDRYLVDHTATTGLWNRWNTQLGKPILDLDDRRHNALRVLTYTSAPMEKDLHITGTPVVTLQLSTTHTDGAVLVYLEDVDEDGQSRYITEDGLRLIHRKLSVDTLYGRTPYHSFNEEDTAPMIPGRVEEIVFEMLPTSVLIRRGHSIRIAIAGADRDTFDRIPAEGDPILTIHRNGIAHSFIELPVIAEK